MHVFSLSLLKWFSTLLFLAHDDTKVLLTWTNKRFVCVLWECCVVCVCVISKWAHPPPNSKRFNFCDHSNLAKWPKIGQNRHFCLYFIHCCYIGPFLALKLHFLSFGPKMAQKSAKNDDFCQNFKKSALSSLRIPMPQHHGNFQVEN